jgi:hypothetical protein
MNKKKNQKIKKIKKIIIKKPNYKKKSIKILKKLSILISIL